MPELLPRGYLDVCSAIRFCERDVEAHRPDAVPQDAGLVEREVLQEDVASALEKALAAGELYAVVMKRSGDLVYVPPAYWRSGYTRPAGDPWDESPSEVRVPVRPFRDAMDGRAVPAGHPPPEEINDWGTALIAAHDLAIWRGHESLPAEPSERPSDWPTPPAERAADEEGLYLFVTGLAMGASERGNPFTRDEIRRLAKKQMLATAREADAAFARLGNRFKNPDRSKGSNQPK